VDQPPGKRCEEIKRFFTAIGFTINKNAPASDSSASFLIGTKNIVMMLFEESLFQKFTNHALADTSKSTEVLLSFDAESRQEVDELARKVTAAGGKVFAQPGESQGWMYAFGFADPDGHRWNVLYMDMAKMPKG
jgi:predicted lactoylglutathione lyase